MTVVRNVPRALGPGPLPGVLNRPDGGRPQLWLLRVSEHMESLADGYGLLDEGERVRHAAFVRDADRERYGAAHIGLRRLLGGYLGIPPEAVAIGREPCPLCAEPHGRPAVHGSGLHFSLSHSGDLVLFAFAVAPVGADVERLPSAEAAGELASVLHSRETAELAVLAPPERRAAFGRCWARKEAYLKGTGAGLAGGTEVTYVGTGVRPAPVEGWTVSDVSVDEGYASAVALSAPL
jgi:4'-phosphopantetheinyl transferase